MLTKKLGKSVEFLFQQIILITKGFLAYAIPDTPNNLQTQLVREHHLRQENLYELKHKADFDASFTSKNNPMMPPGNNNYDDDDYNGSLERQVPFFSLLLNIIQGSSLFLITHLSHRE